jgi:hypothetical protein
LPHPVDTADLTPSNFSLFDCLKEKLTAFHGTTRYELKSAIITIFSEMGRETLLAVFNSWLERLERVIKHVGQYFIQQQKVQH